MMDGRGRLVMQSFVFVLLLVVAVFRQSESCGVTSFNATTISETDLPVKILLSWPAEENITWSMDPVMEAPQGDNRLNEMSKIRVMSWIRSHISLNTSTGTSQNYVQLDKVFDLEEAFESLQTKLSIVKFSIKCNREGAPQTPYEWFLAVKPVNEFIPKFVGAPFNFTIPENSDVGFQIIRLRNVSKDDDVVTSTESDIHEFDMAFLPQTSGGQNDTHQHFFAMADKQNGIVQVNVKPDFESFASAQQAYVKYNITVFDTERWNSSSTLTIYVTDVDDLPPVFFYPGCTLDPCVTFYTCDVDHNYTGLLNNILPAAIQARDGDTLGYGVRYRLKTGPQQPRFRNFLEMDERTGIVNVTQALNAYAPSNEIGIVVEAYEVPPPSVRTVALAATISLIIRIRYPESYYTSTPSPQGDGNVSTGGSSNTVIIAIVVLAVFVFLAFVIAGALFMYFKKRPDKPIYPAEDGEVLEGDDDSDDDSDDDDGDVPTAQSRVTSVQQTRPKSQKQPRTGSNTDSGQWSMNGHAASGLAPAQTRLPNGQAAPNGGVPTQRQQLQRQGPAKGAAGAGKKATGKGKKRPKSAMPASRRSDVSSGGESVPTSGRISMGDINPQDGSGEALDEDTALALHNQMILTNPDYARMFMAQMQDPEACMAFHNQMMMTSPQYANVFFGQQMQGQTGDDYMDEGGAVGGQQRPKQRRLPPLSAPPGGRRSSRKQRREQNTLRRKTEKFDGTKVYPMDIDTSFYTDGHKSKIKLSTRKRNQQPLDPKFWMTVENEYDNVEM